MKFEFCIRDVKEFTDVRGPVIVEPARFDYVKSKFEEEKTRLLKSYYRHGYDPLVVLINKLDDDGQFLEVVQ